MDRNSATGLFLISALLLVYLFFFSPKKEDAKAPGKTPPPTAAATAPAATPAVVAAIAPEAALDTAAISGAAVQDVAVSNENLDITFSTRGGRVAAVRLKKYKTFFGQPLYLFDAKSARMDTRFRTIDGKTIKFSDLVFQPTTSQAANGASVITFTAPVAGGSVVQTYTLPKDSYELSYNLRLNGLERTVAQEPLVFTFIDQVRQTEQDLAQNRTHTTINHYLAAGGLELAEASDNPEEYKAMGPVKWAAHKHNFFVAGIIADQQPFAGGAFNSNVNLADSTTIKTLSSTLTIPVNEVVQGRGQYRFFFGPNSLNLLKDVTPEFDRNVTLGWGLFRWVNRFVVLPVFHFLEQYITSYGIIIALLVLLIKLVTWPLTYKTYESQARMKVLKPEIDALKEKYGDDATKVQQETMKLYQTFGVSPLAGCVPTILTLPILFAMFQFFPNAIELRQESFLWAKDLSSYDVFVKLPFYVKWYGDHVSMFTLLMTASTLLMTWQSNQTNTAMQGPMKTYSYLMPIIFLFVLNSFAAGLTWYYFVSNVITFGQQALTKAFVDDTKIRAQLDANKIKNKDKKPSGIQGRIAEAMKAAQEREAQAKKKQS